MKFTIQTGMEKREVLDRVTGFKHFEDKPIQHTIDVPEKDAYGVPYSEGHMFRAAQKHAQGAVCFPATAS